MFFYIFFGGDFFNFLSYYIQHCFICRPSDSTVPTDAGIEPRTVASGVVVVRRSNHQDRSHPLINAVVCRLAVDDLHEPCGGQQRQAGTLLRLALLRCREGAVQRDYSLPQIILLYFLLFCLFSSLDFSLGSWNAPLYGGPLRLSVSLLPR